MARISDYEYFIKTYKPVENHIQKEEGYYMYETYGEELEFVKKQNPNNIWTLIESDNGKLYIVYGLHLINRFGYIITKKPWKNHVRDFLY